jgi:serine phosphatase RsbU (regulator of sigma subunit)
VRAAKDRNGPTGTSRANAVVAQPARTPGVGAPVVAQPVGGRTPSSTGQPTLAPPVAQPPVVQPQQAAPVANQRAPARSLPNTGTYAAGRIPAASPLTPIVMPVTGTGSHMRTRRFLTPSPEAQPPAPVPVPAPASAQPPVAQPTRPPVAMPPQAPPVAMPVAQAAAQTPPVAEGEAGFNWMDKADLDAGVIKAESPSAEPIERSDILRARDLQQNLLAEVPRIPGYEFATRFEPCDHVSGDFFSFVNLLDGRIGIAIGDVSGHGMQAGLVMSMAKKTLEIYGELIGDPAEVLAKVNDALAGDLGGKMFVSITYAILSPSEGTITWARAGHNPTMAFNVHTGESTQIRPPGMVVGMKAGQTFRDSLQVETTRLRTGDTFLLYTDGVTEMTNAQGEEFEVERLAEILAKCSGDGPDHLLTQVMDRVRHFRGSRPLADDVTLLAISVT